MPAAICIIASVMMKEGMPITVSPNALTRPSEGAERQRQQDRGPSGQRNVGDVDVGFLQREVGDRDAGDVGDGGDREVDLGAEDDEGEADGDDARHRNLGQDVAEIVERRKGWAGEGKRKQRGRISVRNGAMLRIGERRKGPTPLGL